MQRHQLIALWPQRTIYSLFVFLTILDAQQAASLFYDSLAKVSQMALLSKGTAHSLGKFYICSAFSGLTNLGNVEI